jgi:NosR/NirI family nitrous oxide reductase transcriptional regulator
MPASCARSGIAWVLATSLALLVSGAGAAKPLDPEALRDVFPDATRFGEATGEPPAAPALREGEVVGYVFSTQDVVGSLGYSGKPLDVLVGLDLDGRITGATIVEQHEPILVIGVAPEDLDRFVARYRGQDIRGRIEVVRGAAEAGEVNAVSGATISSTVIGDAIVRAARAVARSRRIIGGPGGRLRITGDERPSWQQLVDDGSLTRLRLTVGEVEAALADEGARLYPEATPRRDPDSLFAELFFGLATPAPVGASLVGERTYGRLMADHPPGTQLVFVGGRGAWSFKGTTWRRSGIFDRLQLIQSASTVRFQDDQHVRIDELSADGAPELRELAVFTLPPDGGFDPAAPWRLQVLVAGTAQSGEASYVSFAETYRLPERYLLPSAPNAGAGEEALWRRVWEARTVDIGILVLALACLTAILFFQDMLVRYRRLHAGLRLGFLLFTLLWMGWYAAAQLSVLNVLTFADALRTEFRWDFFLLEPLMFILWSYVAVALLFWGRGVFCGWLCPFGALQELTNRAGRLLGIPQLRLPFGLHERLWPIKYVIFLALFAVALGPAAEAVRLAEVEPFKTTIVLRFDRAWPFVVYALALLAIGLFVERAFCRYLCPLGAAFAIPAKLRLFEWLKRHRQCGAPCQICAVECPVQAIHPDGRINPNECITCLHCQVNYHDGQVCPPMIERRKRRERRAALVQKGREEVPTSG